MSGGADSAKYGICAYDTQHLFTVGDYHSGNKVSCWKSDDGGASLTPSDMGTNKDFRSVYYLDATHAYACGGNGTRAVWNGTTWSSTTGGTGAYLWGIHGADASHVWCVGSSATIRQYDGTSWITNSISPSTSADLYGVSVLKSSYHAWAVGASGTVLYYPGSGTVWTSSNIGVASIMRSVSALDDTHVWAVGDGGVIRFWNGATWSSQTSGTAQPLYSVSAADSTHVWAVGGAGTVLFFDGNTWTVQSSGTTGALRGVFALDANNVWAVGDSGMVMFADPPYVKACGPDYGDPGETLTVYVSGGYTHFDPSGSTLDLGPGITVVRGTLNVLDQTDLSADITIDPGARLGPRDVNVTTYDEVAVPLKGGFVVGSNPTIACVSRGEAGRGWSGDVEITGRQTHFNASSMATFGAGITVNSTTVKDAKHAVANVTVGQAASPGARSVNVVTGAETPRPLAGGFTVAKPPVVTGVSPGSGTTGTRVTVTGSGFGPIQGSGDGNPTSYVSFNGNATAVCDSWSDGKILCEVPAGASPGPVSVTTPDGASNADKYFTPNSPTWYLPEGSTAWGFNTDIAIINPNNQQVTVRVTYLTKDGPVHRPDIKMAPMSRATINPVNQDNLLNTDFSTKVECLEGKSIACDRTMFWRGPGAAAAEGHSSIGVTGPATTWYLPEGSSAWGFECWLLLMNPSSSPANCTVTYMVEGAGPVLRQKTVPANSRASFNMADDIGAADASIMVTSDVPVIPERAMYRNNRREGHDSIGVTAPSNDFYLAEGSTAWGFTTYVLVENPNPDPTDVTLTYMTPDGRIARPAFTLPGLSRKTIKVNDSLPGTDVSTLVHGTLPIVAERAMYWDSGTGEACHDSIGVASPHQAFYLADGRSGYGFERTFETWTLVQNPNDTPVEIGVTYLTYNGAANKSFTDTIPANSRRTYNMADKIKDASAGIVVESKTAGKNVIVERSMYWDNRSAGTCTVGSF